MPGERKEIIMTIKLTLKDIKAYEEGLNRLGDKHLPIALQFAIAKNKKALVNELLTADEQRIKFIEETARRDSDNNIVTDEDTGNIVFKNEAAEKEFYKKYNELFNTDTEVNISTVGMDVIEKCETEDYDNLTVDDISVLLFMLEE